MPDTPAPITGLPETPITTLKVEMDVSWDVVTNAITGAIEGGSSYWCDTFTNLPASSDLRAEIKTRGGIWYDEREFWERGGGAHLEFEAPTEDHPGTADIGQTQLVNGLNIMATSHPRHFADLINENDDATTHDVFLQCVVFGEIIFG